MSTLDSQNLFGSGPHAFQAGSWQRQIDRRGFAGLDGELILDQGLRSRTITQTGRLQAATAGQLTTILAKIDALVDGQLHTLVDNHAQTYERVFVEHFEPTTPARTGRGIWCDYTLRYRQLP